MPSPDVGLSATSDDDQFAADFAEAQRCLRENDTEGLAALASRSAAKRAAEAAARARGGDDA
jgi:hypothetical protein